MSLSTEQTLPHVLALPIVRDLLALAESSKLAPLLQAHREKFLTVSAAATMHHNFTHGLVIHTAEVWQGAEAFFSAAPMSVPYKETFLADCMDGQSAFSMHELFTAVFLHDFAKIVQYEGSENHQWKKM